MEHEYSVHCTLYTVYCTLYSVHCTLVVYIIIAYRLSVWVCILCNTTPPSPTNVSLCNSIVVLTGHVVRRTLYGVHCTAYIVRSATAYVHVHGDTENIVPEPPTPSHPLSWNLAVSRGDSATGA